METIPRYFDPDKWAKQGIKDARINSPTKNLHAPEYWMHIENYTAYLKAYQLESMRLLILRE